MIAERGVSPNNVRTIDRCVYCNSASDLTDEHIIPFALNGTLFLKNASCPACAKITSEFERRVLRGHMGDARTAMGVRSRRKNQKPTLRPFRGKLRGSNEFTDLQRPYPLTPTIMLLPGYIHRASLLDGREPTRAPHHMRLFSPERTPELKDAGLSAIEHNFKPDPDAFSRMIMKVAYCHAVSIFDDLEFERLPVPVILGDAPVMDDLIGAAPESAFAGQPDHVRLSITQTYRDDLYLLNVTFRPFAGDCAPAYEVVAGRSREPFMVQDRNTGDWRSRSGRALA